MILTAAARMIRAINTSGAVECEDSKMPWPSAVEVSLAWSCAAESETVSIPDWIIVAAPRRSRRIPAPSMTEVIQAVLVQQSVDFNLAAGAEVNAPARDNRNHEARGHRGPIALAVLFGRVDRLT